MKKVDLLQKYRQFIPETCHSMICPKPDNETINKAKEQRKKLAEKRITKLKMLNGMKCIIDNENKKYVNVVDDQMDDIYDVYDAEDLDNKDDDTNKK